MTSEESEEVSAIITEAFYAKFSEKLELSTGELQTIVNNAWLKEAQNLGLDVYTIKDSKEVVGAYGLSKQVKPRLTFSFLGKLTAIIKHLGLKRFIQFLKVLLEMNHQPKENELYIDFIAVKKDKRNQNIGQFIMENIYAAANQEQDIKRISLIVLKDNERAKHVYEKAGFKKDYSVQSEKFDILVKSLDKTKTI